ncbi:MAG: cadherin domain-containing protein, partial [Nitratireductor sp.]|nr:cadherin domain-containing protein [Nitratireductor sp.]
MSGPTPIALGNEFRVNTETNSAQQYSNVTALADGGFVVTWSSYLQDTSDYGVYAQRFDASGSPVGSEFRVNTYTNNAQAYSSVEALADGGFVVTWLSLLQDTNNWGIFGQRFDASGSPDGSEFQVNTYVTNGQLYSAVAALADGGFLVTWMSFGQNNSYDIFGMRYDAAGNEVPPPSPLSGQGGALGNEFLINSAVANNQTYPSVTALADGGFVVTWSSYGQDGNVEGIYSQRFDETGAKVGSEFQVNATTFSSQHYSSVAALADGGFVVTWSSLGQDTSNYGIYGQRYDVDGNAIGPEFKINTFTFDNQIYSSVAALADGGFVVSWSSYGQDASGGYGIFAQRYDASGAAVGSEFQVTQTSAGTQFSELLWGAYNVDQLASGELVFTWYGAPSVNGTEVYARVFGLQPAGTVDYAVGDGLYVEGNTLFISIDFGEEVTVNGSPTLGLAGGGTAVFDSQSDANTVRFVYTFQAGDTQADIQVVGLGQTATANIVRPGDTLDHYPNELAFVNPTTDLVATPATPQPVTDEFRVNTYTTSTQLYSSVTALADGGFVVTWSSLGQDGSGWGVYAQRFDASGSPVDSEFRVNDHTASDQIYSSVAALADGGFVVTWSSNGQDGDSYGIYGHRFDASGSPDGSEFQVNTYVTSGQFYSAVAALADGGFLVTWTSFGQNNSYDIFGMRYDAAGNEVTPPSSLLGTGGALGNEFLINSAVTSSQESPSVTALADGGFVVTWASSTGDGDGWGIFGQRFDASGEKTGAEFLVNTYVTNTQFYSSVAALADGGFVVTWSSNGQDGDNWGIFGQRFDASGTAIGFEIPVNNYTTGEQNFSSVTALADGGFVVTWSSYLQDMSGYGVYAQRFDASGAAVGSEFPLAQSTSGIQLAYHVWGSYTVDQLADGNLVFTWHGEPIVNGSEVYARIFSVDTPPNAVPVIVSNGGGETALISIDENTTAVTTVTATDADSGDTLTYSITGGDDAAKFTIDENTGELTFVSAPDFEMPLDYNDNNTYDVEVTVSDGNGGTDVQVIAVTVNDIDDTAPVAPVISTISDDTGSIQGNLALDAFTDDTSLLLSGTAEAASTVTIFDGATQIGTATADGSGNWTYTATGLSETAHTFTATATDAANNTSPASAPFSITVDTTAPETAATGDVTAASDNALNNDQAKVGDTISFTVDFGEAVTVDGGTTLTLSNGGIAAFSAGASDLANGIAVFTHTVAGGETNTTDLEVTGYTGTIADLAGNTAVMAATTDIDVTVDTVAPTVPTVIPVYSGTDTEPVLHGTATTEAGVTTTVTVGGATWEVTPDGTGNWSLDLSDSPDSGTYSPDGEGFNEVTVTSFDLAGNTATDTSTDELEINIMAPVVVSVTPSIGEIIEGVTTFSLVVKFNMSMDTNPAFTPSIGLPSGVASTLTFASQAWSTSTNANDTYTITYTVTDASVDIEDINVSISNARSFGGDPMAPTTEPAVFDIDTLIAEAPTPDLVAGSDTGVSSTDDLTNDTTPTFSFTIPAVGVEADDVIDLVLVDGSGDYVSTLDTLTVTSGGSFDPGESVTLTSSALADGDYHVAIRITDNAGNVRIGNDIDVTVDTMAPTLAITDDEPGVANIAGGNVVFTFTFSEEVAGFDIGDITITGGTPGTLTTSDNTTFTLEVTPDSNSVTDIEVSVASGTVTDIAGNDNATGDSVTQAVDTLRPTVSSMTLDDTALKIGETATLTITFSEAVTGLEITDFTVVGNGALSDIQTSDNIT